MKIGFSLKNKEASAEMDVERLVEKRMDHKAKEPNRKTRYQIKQEEKRKTAELEHRQRMQYMGIMLGLLALLLVFGAIASILGI